MGGASLGTFWGDNVRCRATLQGFCAEAVAKGIKADFDAIGSDEIPSTKVVSVYPMGHFVHGKKQNGALESRLRCITPCFSDGTLVIVWVTDAWEGFFRILPQNRHFGGKDLTVLIEPTNRDIRHGLPRFERKTKAFSRSIDMIYRSLRLFHCFQDISQNVSKFIDFILALKFTHD